LTHECDGWAEERTERHADKRTDILTTIRCAAKNQGRGGRNVWVKVLLSA